MATIITRVTGATAKGSALTNLEMDQNLINLNEALGTTPVVNQSDIGTNPNQVPLNQMLGSMARQDQNSVNIGGGVANLTQVTAQKIYQDTQLTNIRPTLMLDFAKSLKLDPRITFGRASTAAYYDGKTFAVAEQNLIPWSQDFDNAAWIKTSATVVANSIPAPDGTLTANALWEVATTDAHRVYANIATTAVGNTVSVYFKPNGRDYAYIRIRDSSSVERHAYFNLTTGATATLDTGITASIVNAGGGWYRCIATIAVAFSGTQSVLFGSASADATPSYAGDVTKSLFIWGAQLEQRSAVSAYTPTTSSAITNYIPQLMTAAANQARFDFDPITGECKGLLVEEQRANLWSYSAQLDNAFWTKGGSLVRADYAVAPDGTLSADLIAPNSGSATNYNIQASVALTVGTAYTLSAYVKYGGIRYVAATNAGSANYTAIFDVVAGTITTQGANVTNATITPVGNGWFRITCTYTAAYTTPSFYITTAYNAVVNYVSDGSIGIFFWGMQLEAGSFATSYIPTTLAQVTRSADFPQMLGVNFSSWYNKYEGTFVSESYQSPGTNNFILEAMDSPLTGQVFVRQQYSSNQVNSLVYLRTTQHAFNPAPQAINKVATAYKTNNMGSGINGSGASSASGSVPIAGQFTIGAYSAGGFQLNSCIRRITYFPKRLTNAELVEMTA